MSDKQTDREMGFALVETALIIVIVAVIGAIGYWVLTQRNKPSNTTADTTSSTSATKTANGTTASIDQLTQADAQVEDAISKKYEAGEQSSVTSTNAALKDLGGAYNETSF